MEFRGHEHVVECVIFLPTISYPFITEWLDVSSTNDIAHTETNEKVDQDKQQ
jgi:hypothetical protein